MKKTAPPLPDYLRFWMERNIGRSPVWDFPALEDSATLSYQRLHFDNYLNYLQHQKNLDRRILKVKKVMNLLMRNSTRSLKLNPSKTPEKGIFS